MKEPKHYCRECGGHIYRMDLTSNPPKYRWQCAEGCTESALMLKGAPFPTEFEVGGPRSDTTRIRFTDHTGTVEVDHVLCGCELCRLHFGDCVMTNEDAVEGSCNLRRDR